MTTLRLNHNGGLTGSNPLLSMIEHDVNLSTTTKVEVFNFICIIIKNLLKESESYEELQKYRQLRLQNMKVQRYVSTHPNVLQYLQQTIGFERVIDSIDGKEEASLRIAETERLPSKDALQEQLSYVTSIVKRLDCNGTNTKVIRHSGSTSSMKSSSSDDNNGGNDNNTGASTKLTEKQKARLLMEEKLQQQKIRDEQDRKRTIQQIQNDKYVRQNDPNWKPGVSAAAEKSGTSMQTFRDKFGEN